MSARMMKRYLLIGITVFLFAQSAVLSQEKPVRPLTFTELWNNVAFYDTNLEKKRFASLLGRFEGKIGLNVFDYPIQVYGAYYTAASQATEYWDNYLYSGAGVRIIPFRDFRSSGWYNEWLNGVKIFGESLSASYLKNQASAEAAGLKDQDVRYGVEIWHEWNLDDPDFGRPWAELWTNFSTRSTNFSTLESSSYVIYFQPKIGWHLGQGIEIYLRGDVTSSDRDDYWLNIADYGVGLRFEPWRSEGQASDLFRKFKMFAEVLGVSYLKDKPTDLAPPEPNKEVSSDVRFGVEFSYGR